MELAIKALFVDQSMPQSSFEDRLVFFKRRVSAAAITPEVRRISLDLIPDPVRQVVVSDLIAAHAHASQYVHPSLKQIEERVQLAEQGVTIGYDNADELRKFNDEVFEVFALVLVLYLHGLGSCSGDLFEGLFSDWPDWIFHTHRHIAKIDEGYDYKHERQGRLDALKQQRAERIVNRPVRP
jgi:hypothetical protein